MRISIASMPAITRKTSAYAMYISPIFLWSTVVSHSYTTSSGGRPCCGASVSVDSFHCMRCAHQRMTLPVNG